jgi:hypothetical protein
MQRHDDGGSAGEDRRCESQSANRWQNNIRVHIMTSIRVSHCDENDPCINPTEESVGWIHSSGSCRAWNEKISTAFCAPQACAAACSAKNPSIDFALHNQPKESEEVSQKAMESRGDLDGSRLSWTLVTTVVHEDYT